MLDHGGMEGCGRKKREKTSKLGTFPKEAGQAWTTVYGVDLRLSGRETGKKSRLGARRGAEVRFSSEKTLPKNELERQPEGA